MSETDSEQPPESKAEASDEKPEPRLPDPGKEMKLTEPGRHYIDLHRDDET